MTCDEWRAFAHDYALGDLSDPARELLDRHAGSCAECLGEARDLKLVDRTLRLEPEVDPPSRLARRALESVSASPRREFWRIAAALFIAGTLGAASVSAAFSRQLPDDVRRAPRILGDAAKVVPNFLLIRER